MARKFAVNLHINLHIHSTETKKTVCKDPVDDPRVNSDYPLRLLLHTHTVSAGYHDGKLNYYNFASVRKEEHR